MNEIIGGNDGTIRNITRVFMEQAKKSKEFETRTKKGVSNRAQERFHDDCGVPRVSIHDVQPLFQCDMDFNATSRRDPPSQMESEMHLSLVPSFWIGRTT